MSGLLKTCELFRGMDDLALARLAPLARPRTVRQGEYLFLLGDAAECIHVVQQGKIELCFPFSLGGSMKDIPIETISAGGTVGWSAFVDPYRFTLSARSAELSEVLAFGRHDLQRALEGDPANGRAFMQCVAQLVGRRLLGMQALWAREFQRTVTRRLTRPPGDDAPGTAGS